jgi:uncharacterized repeat protein (TIGR02543 family)
MKRILTLSITLLLLYGAARGAKPITVEVSAGSYTLETYYDGTLRYTPGMLADFLGFSGLAAGDTLLYGVDYRIDSAVFAAAAVGKDKALAIYVSLRGTAKADRYELTNGKPYISVLATVRGRPISVTGGSVEDKIYDRTPNASGEVQHLTFSGLVSGEALALGVDYGVTAAFASSRIGEGKPITLDVALKSTATAGNYELINPHSSDKLTGSIVYGHYTITVHDTAFGSYKLETYYDGTPRYTPGMLADFLCFAGLEEGDTLTYGVDYRVDSAVFASPAAGKDKALAIYASLLDTENAGHYTLANAQPFTDVRATVHVLPISVTGGSVADKIYDRTPNVSSEVQHLTFSGLVSGEALALGVDYGVTAAFANSRIGEGKPITLDVALKSTPKANNYELINPHSSDKLSGSIVYGHYNITVHDTAFGSYALETHYDGTLHYTPGMLTDFLCFAELVEGDTLLYGVDYRIDSAVFATADVGKNKALSIYASLLDTENASHYTLTNGAPYTARPVLATVNKRPIGVSGGSVKEKFYDASTSATLDSLIFSDLAHGKKLVYGVDYTATVAFVSSRTGDDKPVEVNVTMLNTSTTSNYTLLNPQSSGKVTGRIYGHAISYLGDLKGRKPTPSSYVDIDLPITLLNLSALGYTFNGWYSSSSGDEQVTEIPLGSTGPKEVWARWTAHTYRVAYDGNGATSGKTDTSNHVYGVDEALTPNGFTRTGYDFAGWATALGSSTVVCGDKESVKNLTAVNNGIFTLYAVWTVTVDSIIYHDPKSAPNPNPTGYTMMQLPITLSELSTAGYTFTGWYDSEAGDNRVTEIPLNSMGDKEFWARWRVHTYRVTYDGNGATSGAMDASDHV